MADLRLLAAGAIAVIFLAGGAMLVAPARSGEAEPPASVVAGRAILAENGCNGSCHQGRVGGGDPLSLYTRTTRRVNARDELRRQVESCVSQLAAPIFPDDIEHVVAALDHDSYHFD